MEPEENLVPATVSDVYSKPAEPVILAEVVPCADEPRWRIWPAILAPIIGVMTGMMAGIVALFFGIFAIGAKLDPNRMEEIIVELFQHPLGIWIMVLPGQLAFLFAAVVPAILSPVPTIKRLRLTKGSLPLWTWLVFMIATPCVGILTGLVIQLLGIESSENLKMFESVIKSQTGLAMLSCIVLIAVTPALAEEFLFRGYMQGRLLRRWSPVAAILLSSLFFALAHIDPVHVAAVFPAGIWMGLVAYRAESIWPSILCHFTNNLISLIATQMGLDTFGFGIAEIVILVPSAIALIVSLVLIFSSRGSNSTDEAVLL